MFLKEAAKNMMNTGGSEMTDVRVLGDPESVNTFIQMVDDHDLDHMESQAAELERLAGTDWCLVTVKVRNWNNDLTPWKAGPVFGSEGFGDGASETLKIILEDVIPVFEREYPSEGRRYYMAGYSLAGLFALWSAYETDRFDGAVAASPSVWYPGWIGFAESHEFRAERAYLSLGDRESKTRNQTMAAVADNILRQKELLEASGKDCVLEWNPGNHFRDADKRTARGMSWMLKKSGR